MYAYTKRTIDFFVALVVLILLLPLLLPVILLLRLTAEGEVFYFQERIGYKNRKFRIWKFATMLKDSPNMVGGIITMRNDPRITPVGRFLRMTKLNELPQIVNILKGDMSVVGPRPLMEKSFRQYTPEVQARVYQSRPGLTGIGSVIFRDEEKLVTECGMDPWVFYRDYIFPYKGALEMWYQDHKSFTVDLQIIAATAWVIFSPHSDLPYRLFKDLPAKPVELEVKVWVS